MTQLPWVRGDIDLAATAGQSITVTINGADPNINLVGTGNDLNIGRHWQCERRRYR